MKRLLRALWTTVFRATGADISWGIRYRDWSFWELTLRARADAVRALLSDWELEPVIDDEGFAQLVVMGADMKDVPLGGPYHEVGIAVPVEPLRGEARPIVVHLYLPVDTEIARWGGVDIMGMPKFLATIDIERRDGEVRVELKDGDRHILTLRATDRRGDPAPFALGVYGTRAGARLRTDFDCEGEIFEGADPAARLELGEHPIASEVRSLLASDRVEGVRVGKHLRGILRRPVRLGPAPARSPLDRVPRRPETTRPPEAAARPAPTGP